MKKTARGAAAAITIFPTCPGCGGTLVPLSDNARDGTPITFKAWTCTSGKCGYTIRLESGKVGRTMNQSE